MSKPPAPSDLADKFMLRMPEGMRDRLKAEAEANNRSMNAEILSRLEATFAQQKRLEQSFEKAENFAQNLNPANISPEDMPMFISNLQSSMERLASVFELMATKTIAHHAEKEGGND